MRALEGKTAIITGAASGMGRSTSLLFCEEGAHVIGFDIDADGLKEVEGEILAKGQRFTPFVGDVRDDAADAAAVDLAVEADGKLDILINGVGINDNMRAIHHLSTEWMEEVIDTNLLGMMKFTREALRPMLAQKDGCIVNISSVGGLRGCIAGAAYTASKHAVNGVTKNTAFMYALEGIRCNAIAPGGYVTNCIPLDPDFEAMKRTGMATEAMPKAGEPEQIATVLLFLCTDAAMDINGAVIPVDSGWIAG